MAACLLQPHQICSLGRDVHHPQPLAAPGTLPAYSWQAEPKL